MSRTNFNDDFSAPTDLFAAAAAADVRSAFITKTYLYLAGAILALVGLEFAYFHVLSTEQITGIAGLMMGTRISWLVVLGLFMAVSWIANSWATHPTSSGVQHAGLGLYVVAQSIILLPLLAVALAWKGPEVVLSAGAATAGLFALMTLAVFLTRKDFSFLGSFLWFAGFGALGFIVISALFGFTIPTLFIYLMIAFACAYILYDTSNVLHHYRIGQHVAASLALFASVALLFWYILQLFLSSRD